jgi:hypothetical protein
MNTVDQRIAALEAEISALKAGKVAQVAPVSVPDETGVRITLIEEPSSFLRPTLSELRRLYDIVCSKFPQFKPRSSASRFADQEAEEYFSGFEWCFERLGFIGRSATPDVKHYCSFWSAECGDWLRKFRPNHRGNIGAGFLAAAVAHNDIPYIVGNEQQGVVWSIGLTAHGGRMPTDAWRKVLTGQLLPATAPERRLGFAPSPDVKIFVG